MWDCGLDSGRADCSGNLKSVLSSSTAAKNGSHFITMPWLPPYGVSSVVRCLSAAHFRRSCTRRSTRPRCCALPIMLAPSGAAAISGKMVRMSRRMAAKMGGGVTAKLRGEEGMRMFRLLSGEIESGAGQSGVSAHQRCERVSTPVRESPERAGQSRTCDAPSGLFLFDHRSQGFALGFRLLHRWCPDSLLPGQCCSLRLWRATFAPLVPGPSAAAYSTFNRTAAAPG